MDIKPTPVNQTSLFFKKEGIGIRKLMCLLKNLEIVDTGHTPHPKRAAKRNITKKKGIPNCQNRIRGMFLLPIEMSDCAANK